MQIVQLSLFAFHINCTSQKIVLNLETYGLAWFFAHNIFNIFQLHDCFSSFFTNECIYFSNIRVNAFDIRIFFVTKLIIVELYYNTNNYT